MKKIKIFLASSNELVSDREAFEREIYRKSKTWIDKGVSLHLEIWEDLSAAVSQSRSQDEYNKKIKEADIFVLLAYSKVGIYTAEEFTQAYELFKKNNKLRIFTYFKNSDKEKEDSLEDFKKELENLEHFYASYSDFNHLWLQFNKELDSLLLEDFENLSPTQKGNLENEIQISTEKKVVEVEKEEETTLPQGLLFGAGLLLSLLAVALSWLSPNPSGIQYISIRILFVLGAGFLGGFIGGFIKFKYQNMVKAGGAFALAMIIYFLNPAASFDHSQKTLLTGTAYLNGTSTKNINVRFQQAQKDKITNSYGVFTIKIHNEDLKDTLDFSFKNEALGLDTVIHLANDNLDLGNLKFYLTKEIEKIPPKIKEEEEKPPKKETKTHKKLVQNLRTFTLSGDNSSITKVTFDGKEYSFDKEGVVRLPKVGTDEKDLKSFKVYLKNGKSRYLEVNDNVPEWDDY